MRDLSKLQIGLIVITAVIAVVFMLFCIEFHFGQRCALPEANSFGKRCGDPFGNWLYDFQSLIVGLLAVCAAVGTIYVSQKATNRLIRSQLQPVSTQIEVVRDDLLEIAKRITKRCENFLDKCDRGRTTHLLYVSEALDDFEKICQLHDERNYTINFDAAFKEQITQLRLQKDRIRGFLLDGESKELNFSDPYWMKKYIHHSVDDVIVDDIQQQFERFKEEVTVWSSKKIEVLSSM